MLGEVGNETVGVAVSVVANCAISVDLCNCVGPFRGLVEFGHDFTLYTFFDKDLVIYLII